MEERIKHTVSLLKVAYALFWAMPVAAVVWGESGASWAGLLAGDVRGTYVMEAVVILLTVVNVPLSLKLFARILGRQLARVGIEQAVRLYALWSIWRLAMLFLPMMCGVVSYYLLMSNNCLLCGLIGLVASLFCVPGEKRLRRELNIDQEGEGGMGDV